MATVSVRYIVNDVDAAIAFYTHHLGFAEVMSPLRPSRCCRAGNCAWCSARQGAQGRQAMPDGTIPRPGGWNRFAIEVADLAGTVEKLRKNGVRFRNDIVTGTGGRQIIAEDPSGNPVELFEPILPEAKLESSGPDHARAGDMCNVR